MTAASHKELRLLVVTQQFPQGSAEAFLAPELSEMKKRVGALILVPRSPGSKVVHGDAAEFLPDAHVRKLVSGEILGVAIRTIARRPVAFLKVLGLLLRSRNPAMFMRNLGVLPKGLWLGALAQELKVDHIHCHWAATVSTMAIIASTVADVPWSLSTHRWDIVENNLLREKSRSARFVRFISRSGVQLAKGNLSADANCQVIHLGVSAKPLVEPTSQNRTFTVLCAANLIEVKGHRYLLTAVAELIRNGDAVRLLVAGKGVLRQSLEQQAEQLGIASSVDFLGVVPHERLLDTYARGEIDVVVLPSVDLGNGHHEGIPVSLMEAMSFGIPVVSTSTGGIPELLGEGAGVLVPPADAPALAGALRELATNSQRAAEVGMRGRARVSSEFSAVDGAARLLELIQPTDGSKA